MAKKKSNSGKSNSGKSNPDMNILDMFQAILGKYPEDQQESILQGMFQLGQDADSLPNFLNLEYKYKRPDYTKQAKPMPDYMQQLMNAATPHDVLEAYDEAHQALGQLGDDEKEKELRNVIYNSLADGLTRNFSKETDFTCLPLLAVMQLVIDFNLTSLRNDVLETVKQDAFFFEFHFSGFEDVIVYTIAKLFKDDLDSLKTIMTTPGFLYDTYVNIIHGVVQMAVDYPKMRLQVILWLGDTITKCYGKTLQPETFDLIVTSLAQIKAVELLPILKEIYKAGDVPNIFIEGGFKEVQKLLKKGTDDLQVNFKDVRELLEILTEQENEGNEEDDDFFCDEEYEEEEEEDIPMYKYTLDITLDHSPRKVYRQLEIPSDLVLAALGKILIAAVGWKGCHLHQFITKDKDYYGIPQNLYDMDYDYDSREYFVDDLLKKVGDKISWEYDFGDSWCHTIKLVAKEEVKDPLGVKIRITKGSGACPPEDCGGVWGYADLLRIIKNPQDEEYEDRMEWLGGSFDPAKFDKRSAQTLVNSCISHLNSLLDDK